MSNILVVDDDPLIRRFVRSILSSQGHSIYEASNGLDGLALARKESLDLVITDFLMPGMDGIEFLETLRGEHPNLPCIMVTAYGTPEAMLGALRERVRDFLLKPFSSADLLQAVRVALGDSPDSEIEVVSALPGWVELRVPCRLPAVSKVEKFLMQLKADLPAKIREEIAYAFREMLANAIEYGGKLDPSKYVTVSYVRLQRAVLYRIQDPGEGFDPRDLEHAAVSNPPDDLLHHATVRERLGLRPGGFGILLTTKLVDELIYNEQRNELIFVKYL